MSRLSNDDWLALVGIARHAISSVILHQRIPDLPPYPGALSQRKGAFVSLYCDGILRGCVGQIENPGPLADLVAGVAISALRDSRFPPIRAEEVSAVKIEISVLSAAERILPEAIVAGEHGLLVVSGNCRGVLLPQVAAERKWSARRLLEETCVKAGLGRDAWRDPTTQVFGFTAEVFSEMEPRAISDP